MLHYIILTGTEKTSITNIDDITSTLRKWASSTSISRKAAVIEAGSKLVILAK